MMSSYSPSRSASSRTAVARWQSLSVSVLLPVGFLLTFLFFLNSQPAFALGESAEAAVETQMATEAVASQTGTIFYVTTTGSGTACTIASPCALQAAANLAQNADEVRVAAGTYTDVGTQILSILRSTTFRGGFTPANWDEPDPIANPTILDGQDARRVIHIISGNPTIEGFIIENGLGTAPGGAGVLVSSGNPTLRFNEIRNNTNQTSQNGAIYVSSNATIAFNRIHSNESLGTNSLGGGIFVLGQAIIEGNEIYNNESGFGGGVFVASPNTVTIQSNVIYANTANNAVGSGGIGSQSTGTLNILHNTIANNSAPASATGGGGVGLFQGTVSVRNNIIANNTAVGGNTGLLNTTATVTGAFNNLFNNTTNVALTDTIVDDPLFVNAGAGDYHLQAASTNINAADPASTVVRDFDQEPRPFNGGFDVGADEYYPAGLTCFARLNSGGVDGDVYGDLQTVINLTTPGDVVKIAGTCTGTGPEIATLNSTITLRGGYDLLDWSEANRGQHAPTILDGQGARLLLRLTAGNPTIDSLRLTGGTAANGSAIFIQGGNPTIQNSIIYENNTTSGGAIGVETGATPTIEFTTITDNTGDGVNFTTGGSIHNSIVYNNSGTQISGGVGHSFNLVSINPLFVDAANDDYRLTAASPALDFGDPAAVLDYDFEGNDRPRGQRPDAGADEANSYPSARFIPTSITQEVDRGTVENFNLTFESNGTLSGTWTLATSQVQGWDISHPALSGVINAEQSLPFGVVVTVPLAATPATPETILFTATSTINPNAVATAVLNLNIRPIREILFTPSYSSTLLPAEVITYTHTITNNGEFTDTIRVRIESDTFGWGELLRPDMSPAAGNSFTMTLPAGGVSLAYVRVTVADFAPAGLVNNTIARAESMADPTVVFATVTDRVTAKATVGTRYVSTIGDDLNNNCRVPSLPCQTVGHAVGQASVGDEVRVGAGEYATAEIPVNATISLRGGWNSSFTAQLEAPTILSAGGLDRIFNISGAATTPYLELLTLREGNRTTGGAILVRNGAQITLNQLTFLENQATRGGALYVSAGTNVTLEKSAFRDNTASVDGGAIFVEGTLNSTNVLLEANEAVNGAAVYIRGTGSALFWHNTIHGNIASQRGGGLYLESGSLTIQNSSLTSNQAAVTSGAIHRVAGTLTADYNNVWNNSAPASNQPMGTNSVSVDPLYIDTFYRLSPVSPILDIGNPASPVEVDFEDNPRPSDQGFDMGWYELAGCLARRGGVVYFSLQEAIDAGGPALIQVSGVCRGVNTLDLGGGNIISQTALIEDDVRIQGGWNSNFSNNTTTNPLPTFINPQGLGRGLYIHNGASPTIESIAIINGDATGLGGGPADEDAGGGVYIETGSPFFSQMGVYSSTAEFGGGIYNDLGSPTFALTGTHDTVLLNTADTLVSDLAYNTATRGGGFYNHNGVINLGNTFIRWNQAVDGAGAYFASGTGGTAANAVFAQNEASGNGGGLYNASNADLLHLTFYANSATGNGGGLYNTGNATVRSHIFQSNTAASGPAIFNTGGGTPTTGYNYYHGHTAPAVVGTAVGTGSITSATPPGLIAPALGNFRLSGTAPAIDKADPASPITADFEADLRPSNLGFDMGADELAGCYARLNNTTIYGSPQAALANAADGDHIDVAGLCIGVQPRDAGAPLGVISQTLYIDKSVSFLGGWRDDFSQRDQVTVLDALGLGRVIYIAPGITPTITSFDLRGGDATVAGGNAHGGGIYINQANAVIETNELYDNTAANGGAIYVANASPTIAVGNHIYQNNATNGAAIYLNNASAGVASVYNNFIYHNTASNQGGALHSAAGSNLLVHNTVVSNTADTGGGVYIAAGSPTVQSGIYQSNQATTGSGAFGQTGSTPVMGYNTFFDNTAAGTAAGGTGDRTADPNLSPEFTIDEASSALNGGSPNSPIVVDFEGDPRPSDQYADMGADEIGNCFARIVGQPTIYYSAQVAVNAAVAGNTIEVDGWCIGANQRLVEGNPAFQALIIDKELTIDGGSWDVSGDGVDAILDARGEGRGLLVTAGISATVQNIELIGGNAAVAGFNNGLGGGVYNAGTLTLNGIYVTENQAADGAAVYQASTGSLLLEQSTIEGNLASNRGGGLFLNGATAAVQNNFLFDNTAANGGGALYNAAGNAAIWHNTVISNTATNNNGGGFFFQGGAPTVGNNIVDSNLGTGIHGTGATLRYNNVVGNTGGNYGGGATNPGNDISLSPLYVNPAGRDYHLQELSAGVDVGDPNSPIANDFDGQQRPVNTGFDIGADETGSCSVRVVGSGPFPTQDFGVLQEAIDYAEANNLTEILIARGECAGTVERSGTFQVGYVSEDLNFIGSLARPNFTATGDYATYFAPSTRINALGDVSNGRAIYIAPGANPTFTDIAFVRGNVAGQGGAIYNNGNTEIYNTSICQSTAQDGGGIYNALGATLLIEGDAQDIGACAVKNTIEDQNGAIVVDTFIAYDGNVATQHGGAIYNDGTIVNITGVGLYENTAVQQGGGIYNSGEMLAQNVIFGFNEAGGNGGGVYNSGTTQNTRLINAVYFRNEATGNGGGLYHSASTTLSLHHNTFNRNSANEGGGLYNAHFDLTLNSTIFYSNTASGGSAGGGVWSAASGTLAFNNFFGNTPTAANIALGSNAVLDDPLLIGSFTLDIESPAIDTADPSLVTLGNPSYEQDIRTLPRPDGGPANEDGNITPYVSDIGAYEHIKLFGCDVVAPFEERTIQAGTTTTYTLLLGNVGQEGPYGPTGYFDRIRVTLDSSSQGWASLVGGPVQEFDLDWLETQPLQLVVTVPPSATIDLVDTTVIACQSLSDTGVTDSGTRVTRIEATPGVIVTPDHELIIAQPGQVITYGHTVKNTGNNNDTFELIANPGPNYANAILVNEDGTILVDNIVDLTAGQAISTWLRVTILNDAPAGGLATPGVVVRSVADPAITDAAQNQIQIDFTTGNRYVAQGDTSDEHNNCTVLSNPCATVQHAVNQASAGDSIFVSVGTYTDFYTRTVGMDVFTETLFINKSVTITGGYNSADEFTTFQPLTNTVMLSGQDQHRVVYVADGITVTLNGFFLANGLDPLQGAGLFNEGADLTLNGMLVVDNQAKFGAGIYHQTGALRLTSNVIARNISIHQNNGDGGGLYIEDGTAVLENNTFAENQANYSDSLVPPTTGNGYGGGFYQFAGELTLLNNIFAQNGGNDQPDTTSTSAYFVDLGATTVLTQGYSLYDNNAGNLPLQASDLITDPLFLDAVYHLSDFSPAVDSGTLSGTLGVADADIDGEPRLMGVGIDRGADELLQVPNFVFEPPLQTALIEEGEVYTYTYTLTNTGDLVDSYTISRTSNTTGGTGWGYAFYPATIDDLIVGDSVTVTLVVTGGQPGYVDTTNLTAASAIDPTLTRVVTAVTTINQVAGVLITPDRSGSGEPGEVITYSHTLTNTGNGPDTFSLTVASQLPAGWVVTIDPATTPVITPTGSIPVTVSVTVPVDGWAGVEHTAVIEAASVFSPTVTDSVTDTTTILPIYGLLIDPSAATYNSPEDAVAVYTHTLTNTGNVTDTVDIEVANGNGLTWTVEALTTPVELEPFGSAVISVSVDVPLGSTGLTHVMLVTATSTLSPSVQATAVNTTTVATVSGVILQPDRSGNAGAGQTAVYAHTLTNNGNASDSFALTSNSSQGWTVNIDPTNTGALAAGQTIPVTVTVSVPGGTAVGTIDVSTITATSANDPAVTDTVTDTTTVVDVPERSVVIAPDNSLATLAGQTIFYYHTITNTGTASDSYALTHNSSEDWTVTLNPTVANLAAGQSTQLEVTVVVPGGVPTNTVDTLVITATSGFDAAVFDMATNTTTVTDTIVAELSLVPNNTGSGAPGTIVTYYHTLTNLGNAADTIDLQANSTGTWIPSAVPLQVTLNPGEQAAITVTVPIPASATNGQVDTTIVRADSGNDNSVLTTAEDVTTVVVDPGTFNGAYLPLIMRAPADTTPPTPTPTATATATATPTATPVTHVPVCIQPTYGSPAGVDLVVTAVEAFPNNPVTGQQVVIRVTIRNQGSTSVSVGNNFYLDAYFNRLPAFAIAGDLAWGIQGADLAAGATRSYEAIYTFGAPGQYWMYGQVDTDNTVAEVNEANNQLGGCAAHVVTVTGTALNPDGGTPTSVPSSAGQPRQTPTPNVLATPTAEPTALPTETAVPTETATATPTPFPAPSETPTPDGSDGSEEEGKATATPEPTVTPSPTVLGKPEE